MDAKAIKQQNPIKTIILLAVMALLVLALFFIVSNRIKPEEELVSSSPVKNLLCMDLDATYPATPKEVVKLYLEISRCFYGETYTDEELEELAKMSRKLFDNELRYNQTEDEYLRSLKIEIQEYKNSGRLISSYSVSSSADVKYYEFKDDSWAQLIAMLSIRNGKGIEPSKERFLLRKDDTGHWKIYGWRLEDLTGNNGG